MLRLIKAQLSGRWQARLGVALFAGAGAAAYEWLYQGRPPSEWSAPVPLSLLVGALVAGWVTNIELADRRPALLKTLPVTTTSIGLTTVLLPLLCFLPVLLVAVPAGLALGMMKSNGELRMVLVFAAVLWTMLAVGQLWAELKPRLVKWPYGRLVHYGLPFIVGGLVGIYSSMAVDVQPGETLFSAVLRWMTPSLGFGALTLGLAMSVLTAFLFVRRDSYVD